ncbi:MAG: catalase [Gammaproteobacteria bacterium]|nr:catalase [Gammaproteobacteria bacterium]
MQLSVHAFPLSDRSVDNGDPSPVVQSEDSVKDAGKTERRALGLSDDRVSLSDQAKIPRSIGDDTRAPDEHFAKERPTKELNVNQESTQQNTEASPRKPQENAKHEAEQKVEKQQIDQLKQRDREVRAHELAHAVTGGAFAGSPQFEYTQGPDGVQYATGGEVSVDTSPVAGNPQATIDKARIVRAAALAPADPSGQDRAVAARASQIGANASAELLRQRNESRAEKFSEDQNSNAFATVPLEKAEGVSVYEGLKSETQRGSYFDEVV